MLVDQLVRFGAFVPPPENNTQVVSVNPNSGVGLALGDTPNFVLYPLGMCAL